MSLEEILVKEEVVCEDQDGVREVASRASTYGDHEVKNEHVIGPETLPPSNLNADRDNMKIHIKSEPEDQCQTYVKIEHVEIEIELGSIQDDMLMEHTGVSKHEPEDASSSYILEKSSVKPVIPVDVVHECKVCGRTFSASSFETHMQSHAEVSTYVGASDVGHGSREASSKTGNYVSDICGESFENNSDLIQLNCTICSRHLLCESSLNTEEQDIRKYTFCCITCKRLFIDDRRLFNIERSKRNSFYHCKLCKQTFIRHNSVCICDICNKKYASKYSLINHMRNHTGDKPYGCKICKKRFTVLDTLVRHQTVHTKEKPYSCDVCAKRFTNKYTLVYHKRVHTGEMPFSCEVCKKKFMRKDHLVDHERIHSGERPHSCEVCAKRFARKPDLVVHARVHTGEKPYECKICYKQFKTASSLKTHERKFKGQQPLKCDICNKRFCYKFYLKLHKLSHDEKNEESSDNEPTQTRPRYKRNRETRDKKPAKEVINTYRRTEKEAVFSCDVCKKQFTKQSSLTQHVELLHSLIVKLEPE